MASTYADSLNTCPHLPYAAVRKGGYITWHHHTYLYQGLNGMHNMVSSTRYVDTGRSLAFRLRVCEKVVYFSYWIFIWDFDILLAVPRLWRLGAFLSSRMLRFVPRTICVGFVVDKVTLEHVCFQYFDFSCQYCSTTAPHYCINLQSTPYNLSNWHRRQKTH